MHTLLVEDDIASLFFMKKLLSKYGTCDSVSDGIAAIDAFVKSLEEDNRYDLLCLDVMMPKMDGLTALKIIRGIEAQAGIADNDKIKIMMTTALSDSNKESVEKSYNGYCDSFMWKPVKVDKFTQELQRLALIF